ncbi:MAG: FAD-dependent monooxygenase [Burkholderiaceae bacterium]
MAQHYDIGIRGDGIVGCTLALLLASQRLKVALIGAPASAAPAPTGTEHSDIRAYSLNAASRALLQSLRAWPQPEWTTPVREMRVCGDGDRDDGGGEVIFSADNLPPPEDGQPPALNWIVQAQALQARLHEAVRFQPLIDRLPLAAQTPPTTPPVSATLLVACEGQASASRAEWGVAWHVQAYAQRAIATRVVCELPHGQVARQWFDGGDILAFLPLNSPADTAPGQASDHAQGNLVAVVWSVSVTRATELLAASDADFCQALQQASRNALGSLRQSAPRAAWPLQRAKAQHWVGQQGGQSWALAGDAAHTVHPLAGLGLNLGLADAAGLAQVLGQRAYWRGVGDLKLLRRYERARQWELMGVAGATDGLQQLFAQPGEFWRAVRNHGLRGFNHSGPLKAWLVRKASGQI